MLGRLHKKGFPSKPWKLAKMASSESRIQELPDDFDKAMNIATLANRATIAGAVGGTGPAPKDRNFEDIISDFSQTPLFMNDRDLSAAATTDAGTPEYRFSSLSK